MNKPFGGDGISGELFEILKDDALKVLHSICQQISTGKGQFSTRQEKVSFHSNPKERRCQRMFKFSSVPSLSRVQLFVTPWTAAHQASLSITNSQSLLKLMAIELVMPSNHLILCRPLLLSPSIFPSIRVFSSESFRHIR